MTVDIRIMRLESRDEAYRILYVDDEPGLLELGKIFLEMNPGVSVDIAEGAHEALELMDSRRYEAIISDYQMPRMDGIELLKLLRGRGDDVPFIIFTGKGREEVAIEALNSGADFYLQKGSDARSQFAELWNMVRHILQRKDSEVQLAASRCLMDAALDSVPDIIVVLDKDCGIIRCNRTGSERGHSALETIIGKVCSSPPAEAGDCQGCDLDRARNEGLTMEFERHDEREGTYLDCRVSPVLNNDEGLQYMVCVARDVTRRKRAEESLRQREAMYRSLVEGSGQGIAILRDGLVLFVNQRAADCMGKTVEQMTGVRYESLVHPDDLEAAGIRMRMREQGELLPNSHLMRFFTESGCTIWTEYSSQPVEWEGAAATLYLFTDVTSRMRMSRLWEEVIGLVGELLEGGRAMEVLARITAISQKNDPDIRSAVLLYDGESRRLMLGAAPEMPQEYRDMLEQGMPVGEGAGSCGTAAERRRLVVVEDIQSDPRCAEMGDFLDLARRHSIRSCYSYPILAGDGGLLGTITNYGRLPGAPDAEAVHLMEQTAKVAALAICQSRGLL